MGYKQQTGEVEVPKGAGVEGFLLAIRNILKLPRVQEVHIDSRGKVTYAHFVPDDVEPALLSIEFETVMPYAVVRSGHVVEVTRPSIENPAVTIGCLLHGAALDHLAPVAWVTGAKPALWAWYHGGTGTGENIRGDDFFGLPVLRDPKFEDNSLLTLVAVQ
jgi:hypothetical protein